MAWIGAAIGLATDVFGSLQGSHSASEANRTNIKLAREQREWEERMSNTAVQRRVQDITRAGGNPALAFTNGASASNPSVAAPTVEPTFRPEWTKGSVSQNMLQAAQLRNMEANTAQQAAQARITNVEADIREGLKTKEITARANRLVEQVDWDDLKTKLLKSQDIQSAAHAKVARESADAAIDKMKQEAELGKLDLESAKRIAEQFGLSTSATSTFMRMVIDLLRMMKKD